MMGYKVSMLKKMSLLVIDSSYGIKNRFLFPSGPLRQPVNDALKSCDAVVILDKNFNKKNMNLFHIKIFTRVIEN